MSDLKGGPGKTLNGVRYDSLPRLFKDVDGDGSHFAPEVYLGGSSITITAGMADGATFTEASSAGAPIGGLYDDDAAVATDEKFAVARLTKNRALHVHRRDSAGNELDPTPTADTSFGSAAQHCSKAGAGAMLSIVASNKNAAVRWLQIHNKAASVVNTDVPILSLPIGAGTANNPVLLALGRDVLGKIGLACSTGVAWAISTSEATATLATATDHDVFAQFN